MPKTPLDVRLDDAAAALRSPDDPAAMTRILARMRTDVPPASPRPRVLRSLMIASTTAFAFFLLWPRGPRAMAFAQVRDVTLAQPRSIARTYDRRTGRLTRTVWREGARYCVESRDDRGEIWQEERGDGRRNLRSMQSRSARSFRAAYPFGYRYAVIDGDFGLRDPDRAESVASLLNAYAVEAPEPVRVGDRLQYRLPEPTGRFRDHVGGFVIEADVGSGRVLEVRDRNSRTVVDYATPVPSARFAFRVADSDVVVVDLDAERPTWQADLSRGAGAWLDEEGKLWLVYRGSVENPPVPVGLKVTGTVVSAPYSRGPVVAVGLRLAARPPTEVEIGGRRVPVRKIGRIAHASILFNPLPTAPNTTSPGR